MSDLHKGHGGVHFHLWVTSVRISPSGEKKQQSYFSLNSIAFLHVCILRLLVLSLHLRTFILYEYTYEIFSFLFNPVCLSDVENRNSLCQILRCILPWQSNTWTFFFLNWKKSYPTKFFFVAGNKYSCIQHGQPVGGVTGRGCEHQAFSLFSSDRFRFKLPLMGMQFSLLNFAESFTSSDKLVPQAFNTARKAGWGRGREESV